MWRKLLGLGKESSTTSIDNPYGIDTDANFCPACGQEYRAGFDTCADCGVSLMPGTEKLAQLRQQDTGGEEYSMEISAADQLVAIQTGKLGYIKPLQQLLKKEQVPSLLVSVDGAKG